MITNSVLVCFIISATALGLSLFMSVMSLLRNVTRAEDKRSIFSINPYKWIMLGFSISATVMFLPIYFNDYFSIEATGGESVIVRGIKTFFMSVHNTIRLFIVDGDFEIIKDTISDPAKVDATLGTICSTYASVLFIIAPVLTAGFILSFVKEATALFRYHLPVKSNIYIMSELNESSIALAEDIVRQEAERAGESVDIEASLYDEAERENYVKCKKTTIVFTEVFERDDELSFELINRAKKIGAICVRRSITDINLKKTRGIKRKLYFISENFDENTDQALNIIRRCAKDKTGRINNKNTEFYIFSDTVESEILTNTIDNGNMKVRCVRMSQYFAVETIKNYSIFKNAILRDGVKNINIVLIGAGSYGTELLKAILWCGQMPGYKLTVHVFDRDDNYEDKLRNVAPEIVLYNGVEKEGEPYYNIVFHSSTPADTVALTDELAKLTDVTDVFIALGNDELNIATALKARIQFGRNNMATGENIPHIQAIVYSTIKNRMLSGGMLSIDGKPYGIDFIGSMESRYSQNFVERREIERYGFASHIAWAVNSGRNKPEEERIREIRDSEAKFNKYEYHRRSSIAEAVHTLHYHEIFKDDPERRANDELIAICEDVRWKVYMRCEGYVSSPEAAVREKRTDHIARMHYRLFEELVLDSEDYEKSRMVKTTIINKKNKRNETANET